MKNNFKFKVSSEMDVNGYDFLYTASRESYEEEVFLITWEDEGEMHSEIYHEKSVEVYLKEKIWVIQ